MTNSTIPAEAMGSPSPVTASFRWEVPNKSTSVQISLDLIDRLEREVIDSFKAVTKRGSEVGGILLGRIAQADKRTVFVENYEPVACDYSRGPLYLLSDADRDRLREILRQLKNSPLSMVGFFRSNTRKDIVIDEEDLAIAQEFFADPNQVFLLVKPFAMKPSAAGFFIWEDGNIHTQTYLQFPFRRSELLKGSPESIVQAGEGKAASAGTPAPVAREERGPMVIPRREERPQVVPPPVLKREEPKPGPVVVPPKREEAIVPPPAPPKREERPAVPPVTFRREERPAVTPPPKREEPPAAPPVSFKREERPTVAPPPPAREEPPAPPRRDERSAAPPPIVPKREERPAPPPLNFRREERPAIVPTAPPKRDERPAASVVVAKREEPPQPPVTAKREERPTAFPKREERPAPLPPVTVKHEEKPAPPVTPKQEEPSKREERPSVQPVVAKREEPTPAPATEKVAKKEERKEERPAVVVAAAKPEPALAAAPAARVEEPEMLLATEPAKGGKTWLWVALVVLLLLAVGGYFMLRQRAGTAETKSADSSLNLKVERNAGQLVLSWNREAELVASAQRATLSINDGDHKEDVDLDLGQLRSGSIVYSPITNDVGFRLEVTDVKKGKSLSESVRVLAGRPSPLMQQAPLKPTTPAETKPPVTPAPATQAPVSQTPAPTPAAQTPAAQTPQQTAAAPPVTLPPPPAEQPKASVPVTAAPPKPDSLAARLRPAESLPEPPKIEGQSSPLTGRAISTPTTTTAPPPVAPPKQEPPKPVAQTPAPPVAQPAAQTPAQPPAQPLRVGGNVREAKVISRIQPPYPPLARQARVSGIVRVEAMIGKDGKVKKATAVSGPPLLRKAAEDSVRQWKYEPGTLNGEPVEVTTQVDVGFTLNR